MSKPATPPTWRRILRPVDDPLVNDIRREFWGRPAIKAWAEREIFGNNVSMEVLHAPAKFDGTYDKTGLPDPLVLTLYFTLREGRIARLIILHNKPASETVIVSA
jgi:hypothetical protein